MGYTAPNVQVVTGSMNETPCSPGNAGVSNMDQLWYQVLQSQLNQGSCQGAQTVGNQQASQNLAQNNQHSTYNPPPTPSSQVAQNVGNQQVSQAQQSTCNRTSPQGSQTVLSNPTPQNTLGQHSAPNLITLATYSPGRAQGLPGILNNSPSAVDILQRIIGQSQSYQPYQGQM